MTKFAIGFCDERVAFEVLVNRAGMRDVFKMMDAELSERGVRGKLTRTVWMLRNARTRADHLLTAEETEHDAIVADIAYSVAYAVRQQLGARALDTLFGVVCQHIPHLQQDAFGTRLRLDPCFDNVSFDEAVDELKLIMGRV